MEIFGIKKITALPYLNLFSIDYADRHQTEKTWIFASRSDKAMSPKKKPMSPDAVVVVPFHCETRKIVLIKEFRVTLNGYQYGFPAGLIDHGETIEIAGKRELFEETGLETVRVLKQSPIVYSSSGMTDESIGIMYVSCKGNPSRINNEASEDIEVLMLSQKEASRLLENSDIPFDVKSWIILNTFATQGII